MFQFEKMAPWAFQEFIQFSFEHQNIIAPGIYASDFDNLITLEKNPRALRHQNKTLSGVLKELKTAMKSAINALLLRDDILESDILTFQQMQLCLENAYTALQLYQIIQLAIPIIERIDSSNRFVQN